MHVRFEEVSARVQRSGRCPNCGKTVRRSTTITNTINPFNRNADSEVKGYAEVRADVDAAAAAWVPDFTHCEPSSSVTERGDR